LREVNPDELEDLANREATQHPLPDGLDAGKAKRMANLTQYSGKWSHEGRKKALSNLRRNVKTMSKQDSKLPAIPTPKVPAPNIRYKHLSPTDLRTMTGRTVAAVTTQEEYDLFVETWNMWMDAHGEEYVLPEDRLDVETICMETVMMRRFQLIMSEKPATDLWTQYNQAHKRLQQARENLLARRADRQASANTKSTNFNIAVIASTMDPAQMQRQLETRAQAKISEEEDFLNGTVDNQASDSDVIDVEAEPG